MGLIKSTNLPAAPAAFSLADVEQHARAVLARARAEADQLLSAARAEAEQVRQQAQRQGQAAGQAAGHAEGLKKGQEQGAAAAKQAALAEQKAKLTEVLTAFGTAAAALDARRAAFEADAAGDVVRLAVAIARRVAHAVATRDPAVVEANVREAVRLVVSKANVRVAVNPGQRELVAALLPQLKVTWPDLHAVEVVEDPSIVPGGCVVTSAGGEVDARLDAQLDRIVAELLPSEAA